MTLRIRFAAAGFIVTPSRGQSGAGQGPRGSAVVITDEIHKRLEKLFDEELKSKIQIKFVGAPKQQNAIRDLIRDVARDRKALDASKQLARELGRAMDTRSSRSFCSC